METIIHAKFYTKDVRILFELLEKVETRCEIRFEETAISLFVLKYDKSMMFYTKLKMNKMIDYNCTINKTFIFDVAEFNRQLRKFSDDDKMELFVQDKQLELVKNNIFVCKISDECVSVTKNIPTLHMSYCVKCTIKDFHKICQKQYFTHIYIDNNKCIFRENHIKFYTENIVTKNNNEPIYALYKLSDMKHITRLIQKQQIKHVGIYIKKNDYPLTIRILFDNIIINFFLLPYEIEENHIPDTTIDPDKDTMLEIVEEPSQDINLVYPIKNHGIPEIRITV